MKLDYSILISPYPLPLKNIGNIKAVTLEEIFSPSVTYPIYNSYLSFLLLTPDTYYEEIAKDKLGWYNSLSQEQKEKISTYATAAQGAKADSALQKADIVSGSGNGTIAVDGTDVAVKGLASAAYRTAGSASGNVPVTGAALGTTANVPVVTNASGQLIPHASGALGTAAFAATTAFDAAGTANTLVTNLSNGQVTTNKNDIATIKGQISDLQAGAVTAITEEEISALFA